MDRYTDRYTYVYIGKYSATKKRSKDHNRMSIVMKFLKLVI